jgi:hypothetical protein
VLAAALVLVATYAAAACGSGGSLSASERDTRAEAACEKVATRIDALGTPKDLAALKSDVAKAVPVVVDGAHDTQALIPDASSTSSTTSLPPFEAYAAAVAAVRDRITSFGETLATSGPSQAAAIQSAVDAATADYDTLDGAAGAAKLTGCTSESWGRVLFESARTIEGGSG